MSHSPDTCRNCGRQAGPQFCGHCGQSLDEHRQPFWRLVGDSFSEWFALDGQLPRTLALLVRPGRLTRRYLEGKRVRYLRPFRLYFVASLLLFASVLSLPSFDLSCCDVYIDGELVARAVDAQPGTSQSVTLFAPSAWTSAVKTVVPGRFAELKRQSPQELMDSFLSSLRQSLPLALVLFLPVLALGFKGLYVRSGILLVDHLVFAIHFQSAVFLALVVIWLGSAAVGLPLIVRLLLTVLGFLLMLAIYLPLALRHVYPRGWLTVVKSALAFLVYLFLLSQTLSAAQIYWLLTL